MTYKVAIDLNDMNSSCLSQREFIQMIKENNAERLNLTIEDIKIVFVGQNPLRLIKGGLS